VEHRLAVDPNVTPVRHDQTDRRLEEDALAAARGADDAEGLAGCDGEVDPAQDRKVEALADAAVLDHRRLAIRGALLTVSPRWIAATCVPADGGTWRRLLRNRCASSAAAAIAAGGERSHACGSGHASSSAASTEVEGRIR
jgi:hypothetical protein